MSNCDNCNENCNERDLPETIPYIAYEAAIERAERHTKRWMITALIMLGIIFAMMISFLIYESQFETYYYEQDGDQVNIVGDSNEVTPNEATPENKTESTQQS